MEGKRGYPYYKGATQNPRGYYRVPLKGSLKGVTIIMEPRQTVWGSEFRVLVRGLAPETQGDPWRYELAGGTWACSLVLTVVVDSTRGHLPGPDIVRIDRLIALS